MVRILVLSALVAVSLALAAGRWPAADPVAAGADEAPGCAVARTDTGDPPRGCAALRSTTPAAAPAAAASRPLATWRAA